MASENKYLTAAGGAVILKPDDAISTVQELILPGAGTIATREWAQSEIGASIPVKLGTNNLLHVVDQKANNVNGGTFTTGAWRTRDLNTVRINNIDGASVTSNQIVLPAGDYWIMASAPAKEVTAHAIRLAQDDGNGFTEVLAGRNARASSADDSLTDAKLNGPFTLASEETLEIQHTCQTTRSSDGFGGAASAADPSPSVSIYTEVMIWKVG